MEKPYFSIQVKQTKTIKEEDALKTLETSLKASNLSYPQRLVYSFHTSLKINDISPLVVLSGISGTGKSQLPRRYAAAMGIYFLNMAVQPRWDSPQDIFGFYNYLEGRYKATEFTRALIQAERFNRKNWTGLNFKKDFHKIDDQMMLVLFDEMNLARVEYYFSDFISKLEMRRGLDLNNPNERQKAEIVLDVGKLQSNGQDMRLYVDSNVLFVGTMNEDESTQSLSDKILDRANLLRFGRPKKLITNQIKGDSSSSQNTLSFDNWTSWIKNPDQLDKTKKQEFDDKIKILNDAMEEIGRPFGHRTCQSILSYIANYPGQINDAFADQIEQRIIPKLRNVPCHDQNISNALQKIEGMIEDIKDTNLYCAFERSREGDYFEWKGVER